MGGYKDFPKGDARRIFTVLVAVSDLGPSATVHYVAERLACTRAEAQRALIAAVTEFGVGLEKDGSVYSITSWGVLDEDEVRRLIAG